MVSHTIGTVLGPIVLGTNINFFLFGIVLYQFASYLSRTSSLRALSRQNPYALNAINYKPDPWPVRAIVYWLMVLDTYHTAVCAYMQWQYTIDHFGDPQILELATWPYASTPIVTILASVTVQCFLAWRIRIITKRNVWFVIIVFLSIVQGLAGLGTGIGALWVSDISRFYELEPVAGVWFCAQVACDMVITTTLILTLNKERTGFKHTDSVINRLIRGAFETAVFATVFCVLDMAMFFAESGNNLHLAFALPMGRIYSNTLLATLNSRQAHREALASSSFDPWVWVGSGPGLGRGQSRRGWGEYRPEGPGVLSGVLGEKISGEGIKVSVTHDIELSPCPTASSPTSPSPSTPSSPSPSSGSATITSSTLRSSLKPCLPPNSLPSGPPMRSILALPSPGTESLPASPRSGMGLTDLEEEDEEIGDKRRFSESVYSLHDVDLADDQEEKTEEAGEAEAEDLRGEAEIKSREQRRSERLEREIVQTLERMPSGKLGRGKKVRGSFPPGF